MLFCRTYCEVISQEILHLGCLNIGTQITARFQLQEQNDT
jgi:hypothetical protein